MEAKSLRIGNLVLFDGEEIREVNLTMLRFIVNAERLGQSIPFEPIPLTEEWLIKMGLVYNGHMHSNGSILVVSPTLEYLGLYMPRHEDDVTIDCPKYVHQLQNLYFALTGQELTFNPE